MTLAFHPLAPGFIAVKLAVSKQFQRTEIRYHLQKTASSMIRVGNANPELSDGDWSPQRYTLRKRTVCLQLQRVGLISLLLRLPLNKEGNKEELAD